MALILNSAGFNVFIRCENDEPPELGGTGALGRELGWDGGVIGPGVTRYIQADRIDSQGAGVLVM